jgi:hypothetical protein
MVQNWDTGQQCTWQLLYVIGSNGAALSHKRDSAASADTTPLQPWDIFLAIKVGSHVRLIAHRQIARSFRGNHNKRLRMRGDTDKLAVVFCCKRSMFKMAWSLLVIKFIRGV